MDMFKDGYYDFWFNLKVFFYRIVFCGKLRYDREVGNIEIFEVDGLLFVLNGFGFVSFF